MRQVGWSVGQTTHRLKIFVIAARMVSVIRSKRRNCFAVGSGLVHLEAVSIAQYQGRILRSLYKSSQGFHHALRGYLFLCSLTGEFIPATGGF
jgi:hypothetical protein